MTPASAVHRVVPSADLLSHGFEVMAEAPGGVQRVRELILQMAVRGRLVPQDPNDQPARLLLGRIDAERGRLCAARGTSPLRKLRPIGREDVPFSVPKGWQWVRLGYAMMLTNGRAFKPVEWATRGLPIIRIQNLNDRSAPFNYCDFEVPAKFHVSDEDLLISWSGTPGTSFGAFVWRRGKAILNQHIFRCEVLAGALTNDFARIAINARLDEMIKQAHGGVGLRHITKGKLENLAIVIPPLTEQRRIVAKVDQLMALCDDLEDRQRRRKAQQARLNRTALHRITAAVDDSEVNDHWQRVRENFDELFDSPDTMAELRQSILQLAVRGRLASQDPSDEPAPALLERIEAEKVRMSKAGTIRNLRSLPPVQDSEARLVLPKGWAWARLGMIANHRLGKMLDKQKNSGSLYPYLRNTNVQWKRFDLRDVKQIRLEPHELEEYRVRNGDLLVCEGGEPGRCAVWEAEGEEMFFQKALHRVRPYGDIEPWYLLYHIQSDALDGTLSSYFTGATIKHMTGQALSRYVLALPPVTEQRRIVERVNYLTALCDEVEAQLSRSNTKAERLAGAIVHHLTRV